MSLDILKEKLKKQETVGLFYLCGNEEYLKDYYYHALLKKTVTDMPEFNVSELSGEALSLNTLENLINSFPMMSDKKFIGIVDLSHDLLKEDYKKELTGLLSSIPDYACVVFMDSALKEGKDSALERIISKAGGLVVQVDHLGQAQLAAWGKKHFKSMGKEISGDDMYYILRIAENDMMSLKNEISKIASFSQNPRISRADIDAVITKSLETNQFALSNALAKRDFKTVTHVIDDLYAQNYNDMQIANLIYRCLVDLLRASWALSAAKKNTDMKADFGTNEYGASKMMQASKALSEKQLIRSVDLCFECEKRLKSESGDKKEMIYHLICQLIMCGDR